MSLRAKIVSLVVGLTLAILGGVWLLLSRSWAGWSVAAVDRDLLARAAAIARRVEVDHGKLEIEHEDEDPALRDPAHPYRILAPRGEVLAVMGDLPWPPAGGGRPAAFTVADATGRAWRIVSAPFAAGEAHGRRRGESQVEVQVAGDAAPHGALEERFRRGLLLVLAGALVAGAVGAAVLAHASLAPLRRVVSEVDAMGAASLERRLRTEGLDPELRRVASAFNGLLFRLEDAMIRQRQLVGRASHALRTPVATILTRAEVALRRERDPGGYRAALEDVTAAAREAAALVSHLLTLSRLDERRGAAAREEIDVRAIAAEIVRLLAPRAEEAGVSLELDVPAGLSILGDAAAVRELLEALLDNAVRYTPRGGHAGVCAASVTAGCAIVVWDSGPGIRLDERGKVFERFFRGAAAQSSGQPGSGLGLAIVKAIADAHGADVTLGDRAGGGLEVTVTFPAGAPDRRSAA